MATRTVTVYGAGAVGGYLGGKLAAMPDAQVTLVGRPAVMNAVRERGLMIREFGAEEVSNPDVVLSAADLSPRDLVLLTVRTYDVERAIPDLQELSSQRGLVAAFQNGVGTEELLAESLGRSRVLACALTVSEGMEEPGIITRYSKTGGVALSTMDGRPVPGWIIDLFAATGLQTTTVTDYRSLRWSKLLLNMLGAPISAILDIDIGHIMSNPDLFRLEQLAFREAGRVMDASGIRTVDLPGYTVRSARLVMRLPRALAQPMLSPRIARARSGRSPGMRADMERGRSEVGDFNGAVARAATKAGVPAPVNEALTELTQDLACHPERRSAFRGRPEALVEYMRNRT